MIVRSDDRRWHFVATFALAFVFLAFVGWTTIRAGRSRCRSLSSSVAETYASFDRSAKIPAYVINRASRSDRLRAFRDRFVRYASRFDLRVVRASDPDTDPDLRKHHPSLNVGQIGCYLSHVRALKEFAKTNAPWCVIFEDDASCSFPSFDRFADGFADSGYDLLALGVRHIERTDGKTYSDAFERDVYANPGIVWGSHAYFVTRPYALSLIDRAFPIAVPYDLYFGSHDGFRIGATLSGCLGDPSESDTQGLVD